MKYFFTGCFLLFVAFTKAQRKPDSVYRQNIATPLLYPVNNPVGMPVANLNAAEQLELHFDDLDNDVKNYYYTLQLCNADWQPANLNSFDYLRGYQQVQFNQYQISSIALTKYTHYQAFVPDRNSMPTNSGNYLLKVYLNGDTSQLVFTKRLFVLDNKAAIGIRMQQPFDSRLMQTHQKLQVVVNVDKLNPFSPQQQIKTVILQNRRWDNSLTDLQPTFIRNNELEYNDENICIFPAGKEYRWADLRSFRFQSDRVASVNYNTNPWEIFLKPEGERSNQQYISYRDADGNFFINTSENVNPFWQGDYAKVHFTYVPRGRQPYVNTQVHLLGALTGNQIGDTSLMHFNDVTGAYEKTLLLKQGYYSYTYATRDEKNEKAIADVSLTDGNNWETENEYTVLVYYRGFGNLYDELVGIVTTHSGAGR
jgi:hypothetical protein